MTTSSSTATSPTLTNDPPGRKWDSFKERERTFVEMQGVPAPQEYNPNLRRATTLDDYQRATHGYPRLSTFMAHEPGAAIVRRFASLNLRILLYKQAEIVCLEHELDELEQKYSHHKHIHYSVREFMNAEPGSVASDIWDKIQRLDIALERYSAPQYPNYEVRS
jgi:hypothetical protein